MSRATSQYQNWVITFYNLINENGGDFIDLSEASDVSSIAFGPPIAKAQWSLEKCPTTGRHHGQGVLRLDRRMVFSTLSEKLKRWTTKFHLEEMKGTWQQNLDYTSKPETHVAGPFRYNIRDPSGPFDRTVEYWWGPPGTGKSTSARRFLKEKGLDVYEVAKSAASKGTWLPGYCGQESVIMDEVDFKWFDESNWKKVLDRMPQTLVAGAGGKNVEWTPEWIILISNYPPDKFLANDAIASRIHQVVPFTKVLTKHTKPTVVNASDRLSFLK